MLGHVLLLLLVGGVAAARADDHLNLPAVKPLMRCEGLAQAGPGAVEGVPVAVQSAVVTETPKGPFCKVNGTIGGVTVFEVDLPVDHWTQRLLQNAFNASGIANGGSCVPALNGEFAVAFGNQSAPAPRSPVRNAESPPRTDGSRATHLTALTAKALIKTFYGQPQRFAYFLGCSAGGAQAMMEVQRHPEDFDGVSAGSPLLLGSLHNIFYHPWESTANRRADGSRILASARLPILHKAVLEHCAAGAGVLDGVLLQPTACRFDRTWVQCKAGVTDSSNCLTSEEVRVVEKLYAGPGDGKGHRFEISGFAIGSELIWQLSTADHIANPEADVGERIKSLLPPPDGDRSAAELNAAFAYTQEWYDKVIASAPSFAATNTDIRPFQQRGGKLILWNGAEDLTIQPEVSVAYYQGVQKALGTKMTDSFMRLFLIPGFGHCLGGEIPFQFDVLTPLMAWTELQRAPEKIVAGRPADGRSAPSPYGGARFTGPYTAIAAPDVPNQFTRAVFPFPDRASYSGRGDPGEAASYKPVRSAAPVPQKFDTQVAALFAPDSQRIPEKGTHVSDGGK
jgi:feruloyl esterase